jgi:hypothetical protein
MQSNWVEWLSSAKFAYNNHPVMASVTEEIKKSRLTEPSGRSEPDEQSKPGKQAERPESILPESADEVTQDLSHRRLDQKEHGTRSVSHTGSADLTGKLCQCVMALIRWKVGADVAVTEHVVWALEEWLCRRGINIYTDLL